MTSTLLSARATFGSNLVAMPTPMNPDGSLDQPGIAAVAKHLVDTGCDGIVVAGTTGESPTLDNDELLLLLNTVRAAVGPATKLVVGVGTNHTAKSVQTARAVAAAGADALLVVTPYYSKPSQDGVVAHTVAIADATDLPVMLYDIPGRTGLALTRETIVALSQHPRIVAVKDAKGDLFEMMSVMAETGMAYYCGIDELNLPYLTAGAAGVVSVMGVVGSDCNRDLIAAVDAGDLARARAINNRVRPLTAALMRTAPGVVTAKAALREVGVIAHASVRAPLLEATDAEVAVIRAALAADGRPVRTELLTA
ncbi:4-hydroxy-tetrahydrodipicolinate synthase [Gordonia neofelifaecis]|uniref:4-hydroxy-tetrahydrodipicolinate synthase n=1 Tax=Gordonia neofelifaecis NRRL B-59395 TaxID=644548 RepID=F1YPS6_9ACTN|nr:4-hydroxy-tetrahydrodipicolinate synthase [Gordonia neofelifaecis]EGD53296.1 dihydrodipicolinate synthase [Gordonia neofelifaecis NRRL B-59395]